jgi:hypothetical protein
VFGIGLQAQIKRGRGYAGAHVVGAFGAQGVGDLVASLAESAFEFWCDRKSGCAVDDCVTVEVEDDAAFAGGFEKSDEFERFSRGDAKVLVREVLLSERGDDGAAVHLDRLGEFGSEGSGRGSILNAGVVDNSERDTASACFCESLLRAEHHSSPSS